MHEECASLSRRKVINFRSLSENVSNYLREIEYLSDGKKHVQKNIPVAIDLNLGLIVYYASIEAGTQLDLNFLCSQSA